MRPSGGTFAWGVQQTRAARHCADDTLSDAEIAYDCAIGKATLERWKLRPEFQQRVVALRAELAAAELTGGIADRQGRVDKLERLLARLEQVVLERAAQPTMRRVAGGTTGVVVHQTKMVGMGKNARLIDEYVVDAGTIREMRALMQQAAQELGQWTERREVSGKDGGPVHIDLTGLTDEELDILERARGKLDTRPGGHSG